MERGRILEPVIAGIFAANHEEFHVGECGMIEHSEYPFLIGSPDRLLLQAQPDELDDSDSDIVISGLEIKTADISQVVYWGEEDSDQIPQEYLLQTQW